MTKIQRSLCIAAGSVVLWSGCHRALDVPQVESGWDIYSGENYRYGPSVILENDTVIHVWFAAPGAVYGKNRLMYDSSAQKQAEPVDGTKNISQKFTIKEPFWGVTLPSPTWGKHPCGLTFSLYAWDDNRSYAENIAHTALACATFKDYNDGQNIGVSRDEKFPAGKYLWVVSAGKSSYSGVWWSLKDWPATENFRDGIPVQGGSWVAQCVLEPTSGEYFWDQASYRRSFDGGKTWTPEKMVLLPTEFSSDHFSVCDPGAAQWGGYYYIGYTSTQNPGMVENHVYISRSKSPEGPWEKWNGTGWTSGRDVEPMIRYTDDPKAFGAGEPSIVVLNGTVYLYYTWNATGTQTTTTRLVTADASDPNWPAHLTCHGTVINKSDIPGADHCDVKYREDIGKFQAIHTASRMKADSYIMLWESEDGISFYKKARLHEGLQPYLHNCGWSGDPQGHIRKGVKQYLSYAYGSPTAAWGVWKTRWCPLKIQE